MGYLGVWINIYNSFVLCILSMHGRFPVNVRRQCVSADNLDICRFVCLKKDQFSFNVQERKSKISGNFNIRTHLHIFTYNYGTYKLNNMYTYQPSHVFPYTFDWQLQTDTIFLLHLFSWTFTKLYLHKFFKFICAQIFSKSNYPYLNVC